MRSVDDELAATMVARVGLDRPVSLYVVAGAAAAARKVARALEREGYDVALAWGPHTGLERTLRQQLDLVVAVENVAAPLEDHDVAALRAAAPHVPLVVVCLAEHERPQALLNAGVDGLVIEAGGSNALGPVVRAVLSGYVAFPRALRPAVEAPALSARERQVVQLLVEGLTNREIAARLFLSESMVKRHLSSAFRRLGVSTRREAVAAALMWEQ